MASGSWIDWLNASLLACHKEERAGIYRLLVNQKEYGENYEASTCIFILNACRTKPA